MGGWGWGDARTPTGQTLPTAVTTAVNSHSKLSELLQLGRAEKFVFVFKGAGGRAAVEVGGGFRVLGREGGRGRERSSYLLSRA